MIKAQGTGFLDTAPLWEGKYFEIQQFEFPGMELRQFRPKPIPGNIRLGHQMEYVFKQLVERSPSYKVLLHNLPISQGKRTIGEIDFILEDTASNKVIHVELSYKFYVINPETSDPILRLIGPNLRDTFFSKIEKIKNKQFPLLHTEEGSKALNAHNINHLDIEHQCCFKAQLFQPYPSKTVNIEPLNKACMTGYWLRFDDFNNSAFASAQFYMPSKSEWVVVPNDQVSWKTHDKIIVEISNRLSQENAPMIWLKTADATFEKLFVVWW